MVEWPSITCKLHVIETSIRNSNTSNTPPQLQNPHCSEYILRWAIADEQRCNWTLPFFDHNVSHSKELAGSVAWELCRINFQQMVSLLMIPTSSLWHFKIVLTNFQACIFSSQIQSSVQRRIVSKLSCSILNFRSSTASFHNFSRELNREQYSPNYSHAQRQLLWDIADRTPLAVEHALKPVLIRKLRDRDSGQTPPPKKTVLIHRSHPTRPMLSSSEITIIPVDPMISRISPTIISFDPIHSETIQHTHANRKSFAICPSFWPNNIFVPRCFCWFIPPSPLLSIVVKHIKFGNFFSIPSLRPGNLINSANS